MSVRSRDDLKYLKRILVKVGTSVIIHSDGSVALSRLGNLVEQIVHLQKAGKEVILVTSGAVGMGTLKLNQQALLSTPLRNHIHGGSNSITKLLDNRAYAAAGQSSLMALYEILFTQRQVSVSQILLTDEDFQSTERRDNLRSTLNALLSLGVVPILNENDVISTRKTPLRDEVGKVLWDNDSLAMLVSQELGVELMILLSDVEGLYKEPPSADNPHPEVIHTFARSAPRSMSFNVGEKSRVGRGGMQAKIEAALKALEAVKAVVIASGYKIDVIKDLMEGKLVGTIFVHQPFDETSNKAKDGDVEVYKKMGTMIRSSSRSLRSQLTSEERAAIVDRIAKALIEHKKDILDANKKDIEQATEKKIDSVLKSRLLLDEAKLNTLAKGISQIASSGDPIGRVIKKTELADGLHLQKETVPIGVLLVIFESRPDALPQIAALAIKSGNGLLLKGGKEAVHSNTALYDVITTAIDQATNGKIKGRELIQMIETRQAVDKLLKHGHEFIDLVIPRGSSELVKHVQDSSKIPVLGHSEGICHIYVDKHADITKSIPIIVDSKTDYPSACNAVETILIHSKLSEQSQRLIVSELQKHNVSIFGGPKATTRLGLSPAKSLQQEYSDLAVTIELVDSVDEAIDHINTYGSSHTDAILTEDDAAANKFLNAVDSACVFRNCSTRFADGFRFGLGAEVGISTSRIHARGPVGIEGLMTTKWKLVSSSTSPQIVADYSKGRRSFTHVEAPVARL